MNADAPINSGDAREPIDDLRDDALAAMDRLNDSARIQEAARMLPNNRELTAEEVQRTVDDFKAHLTAHGLSAKKVSKEAGYGAGVISEWMRGRYVGDVDKVTRAVNNWIERDTRRRNARTSSDYVKTWIAESMRGIVQQADKLTMMAAIFVPSGAGKTKVLKCLTEEMNGLFVSATQGMSSRDLFRAIASQLGWRKEGGTRGEMLAFIVGALAGTHRPIFVDEAQKLGSSIGFLRDIYDQAHVPIIFAGTADVLHLVNDRGNGRGQFSSRTIPYNWTDFCRDAEHPGGGEGRDLFTIEEIRDFFHSKKIRFDRDGLSMIHKLACLASYGTLRLVENLIDMIRGLEGGMGAITREQILQALPLVVGSNAAHLARLMDREAQRPATITLAKVG